MACYARGASAMVNHVHLAQVYFEKQWKSSTVTGKMLSESVGFFFFASLERIINLIASLLK